LIDDMRKSSIFPSDTYSSGGWEPSFALYNQGKAAMCYTYPWVLEQMSPKVQEDSVVIPFPKMPNAVKDPSTFVNGSAIYGLVLNKSSFFNPDKKELLVDFADFIVSDETLTALFRSGMLITKEIELDISLASTIIQKVLQATDGLELLPAHITTFPAASSFDTYKNALDELFAGMISPMEFVDHVQKKLEQEKIKN
ncbi:MAG: hypothetical protein MJE63_31910, partial [Proteobacteria bacterium]|nr:hypothetical protein [Pseudomonadota bacterium]